jgi:GntR family transcriptional regulator
MPTPKHLAITNALREQCRDLAVGTRLRSEKDLAVEFEVSRMTVRQALDALAAEGRVERVPGSGTFVRLPTVEMGPSLTSFTEDMRARGLLPSSRLIAYEEVAVPAEVATDLGVEADDKVIRMERLRFADAEPMCVEVAYLAMRFRRTLDDADLEGSLHEALAKAGTVITSGTRRVRAVTAPSPDAELLGLPERAPALEIVDVFCDTNRRPVHRSRSRYRFDRYEVMSELHRA